MKIIVGDLWEQTGYLVVPINLTVNKYGHAVMGRGVARQCTDRYNGMAEYVGSYVSPSQPRLIYDDIYNLIFLPVKYHWSDKADISLITNMVSSLSEVHYSAKEVFLPLLGCGFGELEPLPVLTVLAEHLDDRFTLVLKDGTVKSRYASAFNTGARKDKT